MKQYTLLWFPTASNEARGILSIKVFNTKKSLLEFANGIGMEEEYLEPLGNKKLVWIYKKFYY